MVITATIHSDKWFAAVKAKARQLELSVSAVLADEARLFTGQMLNLTPPTKGAMPRDTPPTIGELKRKTALGTGENAVRRDILRSMTPADPDWPESAKFLRNARIRDIVLRGDVRAFQKILKNQKGKIGSWLVKPFSPSLHTQSRNARGRVNRSQRTFIIGNQQLADYWNYMRTILAHVGRLKSGWAPAFIRLGGSRIPNFVRRHLGAAPRGWVKIEGLQTTTPRIVVANSAIGVGALTGLVNSTFKARAQAITRRMRLVAKNFSTAGVDEIKRVREAHGEI